MASVAKAVASIAKAVASVAETIAVVDIASTPDDFPATINGMSKQLYIYPVKKGIKFGRKSNSFYFNG
jgi:hypothetical protein